MYFYKFHHQLQQYHKKYNFATNFTHFHKNYPQEFPRKNIFCKSTQFRKNAIEARGGYIDVQLNPTLLQVSPEYFFDLMLEVSGETDKKAICEKLRTEFREQKTDIDFLESIETKFIGTVIKEHGSDMAVDVIINIMESCISVVSPVAGKIMSNVAKAIRTGLKQGK